MEAAVKDFPSSSASSLYSPTSTSTFLSLSLCLSLSLPPVKKKKTHLSAME